MTQRRFNLRPVKSYKHVIDIQGDLVLAVQQNFILADAVDAPILTGAAGVEVASQIKSIYLRVEAYATSAAALSNIYMTVMKNPSNALPTPTANLIGVSNVKKQIIHQEMVMMQQVAEGNPRVLFKGVIRIPRNYQRMSQDDTLLLSLLAPGVNAFFCIQCIYKEFR